MSSLTLKDFRNLFSQYYSKSQISRKLKHVQKLGQCYFCNGYWFLPLSLYLQSYSKSKSARKKSYFKGQIGEVQVALLLQKCFPSKKAFALFGNPIAERGIDFLVLKEGIPYCAIEVTFYQKTGFLHTREINRYIKNLDLWSNIYPDIFKVIAVQSADNLKKNPYLKNAYVNFVKNKIAIKVMR